MEVKSYRGFLIISGDPTAPIDYPYRIGDCYFKSISEARREIDKTWKETREVVEVKSGQQ